MPNMFKQDSVDETFGARHPTVDCPRCNPSIAQHSRLVCHGKGFFARSVGGWGAGRARYFHTRHFGGCGTLLRVGSLRRRTATCKGVMEPKPSAFPTVGLGVHSG